MPVTAPHYNDVIGQAAGLPTTMGLFSFIGVAVTSATVVIYGKAIWDPVELIGKFTNPALLVFSLVALCIATLATNIAANVVSPANDFANVWPSKIDFRTGGLSRSGGRTSPSGFGAGNG